MKIAGLEVPQVENLDMLNIYDKILLALIVNNNNNGINVENLRKILSKNSRYNRILENNILQSCLNKLIEMNIIKSIFNLDTNEEIFTINNMVEVG
jgi:hypothetical protein